MITLSGLLSVINSTKPITINLFDENELLLITFNHPGYQSLDDNLEESEITKIVFKSLYNVDVYINTAVN